MHRARVWLGTTPAGAPYVPLVSHAGYRLHKAVLSDWDHARALLSHTPHAATTTALTKALQLVRGQPMSGINPIRYGWSDLDRQQMINTIADAAHELTTRALRQRQARLANWSAAIGTTVEPSSELLWRDRIQAAHIGADPDQLHTLITHLQLTLEPLGPLEPATTRLINSFATTR